MTPQTTNHNKDQSTNRTDHDYETHPKPSILLLTAGLAVLVCKGNAQTVDDQIQVARSALKADRKATVAEAMQFTEPEAKAFWPLYEQYRAEMDKSGDALLKLVKEYAQLYPNVPDDRAKVMLKDLADLREASGWKPGIPTSRRSRRSCRRPRRCASPRWTAGSTWRCRSNSPPEIPLVPIEGRLTGQAAGAAVVAEGVPGGSVVATYELTATVAAIDKASRKVTLVDAGTESRQTVKVGPEAVNFDQIQVGDQLKITAAEELVVYVAGRR